MCASFWGHIKTQSQRRVERVAYFHFLVQKKVLLYKVYGRSAFFSMIFFFFPFIDLIEDVSMERDKGDASSGGSPGISGV